MALFRTSNVQSTTSDSRVAKQDIYDENFRRHISIKMG
jgi:hypothetical protein